MTKNECRLKMGIDSVEDYIDKIFVTKVRKNNSSNNTIVPLNIVPYFHCWLFYNFYLIHNSMLKLVFILQKIKSHLEILMYICKHLSTTIFACLNSFSQLLKWASLWFNNTRFLFQQDIYFPFIWTAILTSVTLSVYIYL